MKEQKEGMKKKSEGGMRKKGAGMKKEVGFGARLGKDKVKMSVDGPACK